MKVARKLQNVVSGTKTWKKPRMVECSLERLLEQVLGDEEIFGKKSDFLWKLLEDGTAFMEAEDRLT